ncbi:glutamate decarboxylase [Gilbertella persicaria]|uniref:glutamate decarboxylase n=1 Tax=Gilbertella persicaria TaxID=101096 RepID=UPI0022203AF4|nr:glutamate decarboxylase [Gilbertella persicaria]KAI8097851.1 glutamate decarboxylase [Gilbertella persicaria]
MVFLSNAISNARLQETNNKGELHHESVGTTVYGTRWASQDIPRFEMPEEEMPSNVAYRLIKDDLALDGNPALNLATFVTTYMEDEAEKLMAENLSKNFIDYEEYPQSVELCNRCVNMLARLYHAPMHSADEESLGCSTVGSSEAIILATLAMKRRWQDARKAKGLPIDKPNLVLGANCQVAWHKATRYLEIESREVECTEECLYMDPHKAAELVDENTIGVCAILGSTYTGHYEDVQTLNTLLEAKNKANGWDVNIHVDAASGGMVAPFVNPDLVWDFRLNRVVSINVSGHKYGLTYAGIGFAIWRSKEYLPESLIFNINYLGSDQASFTLNFSKGAAHIIAQYYILIRLGQSGFKKIMGNLTDTADHLSERLLSTGRFEILSETNGRGLPLVAFRLKGEQHYDEFDLSTKLRERGWIVPAYTMAPKVEHIKLLRVVIREDFSRSRCEILVKDIVAALHFLDHTDREVINNKRKHHQKHSHSSLYASNSNKAGVKASKKAEHEANEKTEDNKKPVQGIC